MIVIIESYGTFFFFYCYWNKTQIKTEMGKILCFAILPKHYDVPLRCASGRTTLLHCGISDALLKYTYYCATSE